MAFVVNNKVLGEKLIDQLDKTRRESIDSLEKLSTGQVFTNSDPRPADHALAEGLENKLRSLSASKRNINDAVSLLQTAESGLSEISNIMTRMKEINVAAASSTVSDTDRKFLFVEYQALYDEIDRIATSTEFNGLPILNGKAANAPKSLIFHLDDPHISDGEGSVKKGENINDVVFDGVKNVVATTKGLGLKTAKDLLANSEENSGISLEDAQDLLKAESDDYSAGFSTVYDKALNVLSTHRANYGSIQERLNQAMDYNSVFAENIAAAKSKIADTDYATEITKLTQNNILIQATTGLIAQNNLNSSLAMNLIGTLYK